MNLSLSKPEKAVIKFFYVAFLNALVVGLFAGMAFSLDLPHVGALFIAILMLMLGIASLVAMLLNAGKS